MPRLLLLIVFVVLVHIRAIPGPKHPSAVPNGYPSTINSGSSGNNSMNGNNSSELSMLPTITPTVINNGDNINNNPTQSPTVLIPTNSNSNSNSNNPSYDFNGQSMAPSVSPVLAPASPTLEISIKPTIIPTVLSSSSSPPSTAPSLVAPSVSPVLAPASPTLEISIKPTIIPTVLSSSSSPPSTAPSLVAPQSLPTSPLSLSVYPTTAPSLVAPFQSSMAPSLSAPPSTNFNSFTKYIIYYTRPSYDNYHIDEANNNYIILVAVCSILDCETSDVTIDYVNEITPITSLNYKKIELLPKFKMQASFKTPLNTKIQKSYLNSYDMSKLMNNSLSNKTLQQYIRSSVGDDKVLNGTIICGPDSNDHFCDVASFYEFFVLPTTNFERKCFDYKVYNWENNDDNIINGYVIWVLILYFLWFSTLLLVLFALCKRFVCSTSLLSRSLIGIKVCLNWFVNSSNQYDLQATLESCKLLQGVVIILLSGVRLAYFVILTLATYNSKTNNFACTELAVIGMNSKDWNRNVLMINTISYPLILVAVIVRQVWHLAEMRNVGIITHCRRNNRCHMAVLDILRKYLTLASIGIILVCCLSYAIADPNVSVYTSVCNSFIVFTCCAILIINQYNLYGLNGLIITKDSNFMRHRNSIDLVSNIMNTTVESADTAEPNNNVYYPEIHDIRTYTITSLLAILNILIMIPAVMANYYSAFIVYSLFSRLLEIAAAYLLVTTFTIQGDPLNKRLYRQISHNNIVLDTDSSCNSSSLVADIGNNDSISKQQLRSRDSTINSISSRKPIPYKPLTIMSGGSVGKHEYNNINWLSDWLGDTEWENNEDNSYAPESPHSVTESFHNNTNNSISKPGNMHSNRHSNSYSVVRSTL